jgi:iron complex outermembrane receptor protein
MNNPAHPARLAPAFAFPSEVLSVTRKRLPELLLLAFPLAATSAFADEAEKLESVTVTATSSPRTDDQLSQPVTVINRQDLQNLNASNLGDTLANLPGMASSGFAPGAGRPIIRGLDGGRVKMLENGMGVNDVSALSPDHRVATETLGAAQVEVLRGPATLLYGSGAIGGLVNVVNRRLPLTLPGSGLTGDAQVRLGTNAGEKSANVDLEGAVGNFAWHVDGLTDQGGDYRFPGLSVAGDTNSPTGRMPNSQYKSQQVGLGGSWISGDLLLGLSTQHGTSVYGVPNETSYLDMTQGSTELLARMNTNGFFQTITAKYGHSHYRHNEVDLPSEAVDSTFRSVSDELRIELKHAPVLGFAGTVLLQSDRRQYSALTPDGSVELVEPTNTKALALALVEERDFGPVVLDFGLRTESEKHLPLTSSPRSYALTSAQAGVLWRFAQGFNLALNMASSQRAPTPSELFTDGPHDGTATFEVGNANLSKERSQAFDVTLRKTDGTVRGALTLFTHRFANFIYGQFVDANHDGIADRVTDAGVLDPNGDYVYLQYTQQAAKFSGGEFELTTDTGVKGLALRVFGDTVRATLADGTPLPRIAPARLGLGVAYAGGPWRGGANLTRVSAQNRISPLETTTPGYTRLDLNAAYDFKWQNSKLSLYGVMRNATNQVIRLHTSFLKDTVPQPGRALLVGLRTTF